MGKYPTLARKSWVRVVKMFVMPNHKVIPSGLVSASIIMTLKFRLSNPAHCGILKAGQVQGDERNTPLLTAGMINLLRV